jgi:hypothetical protein
VRSTDETFQKKEKENSHTGAVVKSQATIGVFKSSMMCGGNVESLCAYGSQKIPFFRLLRRNFS